MSSAETDRAGDCPLPETLSRVARGVAPAGEEAAVRDHLDGCAVCRQEFDRQLGPTEEFAGLCDFSRNGIDKDLEAIQAGRVPPLPRAEVCQGQVLLADGLRLPLPRSARYLASLGNYDVVSILGAGAMGVVLKAFDRTLEREVALKLLGPSLVHDDAARQRFIREARAAARLNHPRVVRVHAVVADQEIPFIDMEYVEGSSLAALIAEEGKLEAHRAATIAGQVLSALGHAHQHDVIHRDVKPGNVLVEDSTGAAKLADFGLARGIAGAVRHTKEGTILGTPSYMSPEQAAGTHNLDGRSDLFSVGVMLFEMLVGAVPFPGSDPYQVIKSICKEPTPDPCRLNPAIPRPLAEIVSRAMEKDPAGRYQSAGAFMEALDAYLNSPQRPVRSGADSGTCSSCLRRLVSTFSLVGSCRICGAPICSACWQARGIRHCAEHTANDGASDAAATKEGHHAGPSLAERPSTGQKAQAPAQEQDSGVAGAGPSGRQTPSASRQLEEKIRRARAAGRPAISAAEARVAEESFLRLVENSLQSIREVTDPCRQVVIAVKDWSKIARATRRTMGLTQAASPLKPVRQPAASCPLGAGLRYDLCSRGLAWRRGRVVIEADHLARVSRFAAERWDDQPVSRIELESLLNEIAREAAQEETWHLAILGSPTGWTVEARDFVSGRGVRPFRDRLLSVVLLLSDTAEFLYGETDERLAPFREAFSSDVDAAILQAARDFLEDYFQLDDSLSLQTLVGELGISRRAAIQVFRLLAAEGQYVLDLLDDLGMVLSTKR